MCSLGLQGVVRGAKCRTTIANDSSLNNRSIGQPAVPGPPRPNELWVADFTYVATWAGFVYVAFVIDVFARRIIGWRVARAMRTELVLDALEQALSSRSGVQGVVHHSDRGSQYLSIRYSERLHRSGRPASVGSVGAYLRQRTGRDHHRLYKTEVIHRRGPWRHLEAVDTQRWNGSTGSITGGCSSRLATSRRRSSRRRIIIQR